jgi:hypothetical protein
MGAFHSCLGLLVEAVEERLDDIWRDDALELPEVAMLTWREITPLHRAPPFPYAARYSSTRRESSDDVSVPALAAWRFKRCNSSSRNTKVDFVLGPGFGDLPIRVFLTS